ncbi:hypothetical protein [Bacillus sp. OTU530]
MKVKITKKEAKQLSKDIRNVAKKYGFSTPGSKANDKQAAKS